MILFKRPEIKEYRQKRYCQALKVLPGKVGFRQARTFLGKAFESKEEKGGKICIIFQSRLSNLIAGEGDFLIKTHEGHFYALSEKDFWELHEEVGKDIIRSVKISVTAGYKLALEGIKVLGEKRAKSKENYEEYSAPYYEAQGRKEAYQYVLNLLEIGREE